MPRNDREGWHRFTFEMEPETAERLREEAEALGTSLTAIIREAIRAHLDTPLEPDPVRYPPTRGGRPADWNR